MSRVVIAMISVAIALWFYPILWLWFPTTNPLVVVSHGDTAGYDQAAPGRAGTIVRKTRENTRRRTG